MGDAPKDTFAICGVPEAPGVAFEKGFDDGYKRGLEDAAKICERNIMGTKKMKLTDLIEALEKMLDEVGDVYAENEKGQAISGVDYVWDEDDKNVIAVTVA